MARMYGFTGLLSGKMGNAVFRARGGQQVVTQYNPIVTNPNTEAQQGSRARFKLVSQLAVVFSSLIGGFGTMSVTKRAGKGKMGVNAAFVGINYPLTQLNPSPSAAEKAVIPMEKVQLTSSNRPFGSISLLEQSSDGRKNVQITLHAPNMKDGDKAEIVIVGYGSAALGNTPYVLDVKEGTFRNHNVSINSEVLSNGQKVTILAFGVAIDEDKVARLALDNMQSEEDFISEVGISTILKSGAGVATATIGANITISAGE